MIELQNIDFKMCVRRESIIAVVEAEDEDGIHVDIYLSNGHIVSASHTYSEFMDISGLRS